MVETLENIKKQEQQQQQQQQQEQQQQQQPQQQNNTGVAYCFGLGAEGQLGYGGQENKVIPSYVKLQNIVNISAGGQFTVFTLLDGSVYVCGSNKKGQIGFDNDQDILLPKQIPYLSKIKQVACGDWHSVALDFSGVCYSTGYNKNGCLGNGQFQNTTQFQKIQMNSSISSIAAGRNISLFINVDGQILSAGIAFLHGNQENKDQENIKPIKTLEGTQIVQISAGFACCACVDKQGKAYTWGYGNEFQLGHGDNKNQKTPKQIEKFVTDNIQVVQISCSRGDKHCHMGCVDTNGNVYTWGSGYKGKLGHGKSWTHDKNYDQKIPKKIEAIKDIPIKQFIAGGIHSAVVSQDGKLMTFGCGSDGRLGHADIGTHKYLYKEGFPKTIETLKDQFVIIAFSSYYHMVCLCSTQKNK